jgi:hypothetical protein
MSKKHKQLYVSETHTLSQSNGELYISGDNFDIVWNTETLFTDLPFIIRLVLQAREETNNMVKEEIEDQLKNIKSFLDRYEKK